MSHKRGAQPGNANAIKHGFYSRRFTRLEMDDLENATLDHLMDAIVLLKVVGRRVLDMSQQEEVDFESWMKALETLGRTQVRIAALLRASMLSKGKFEDALLPQIQEAVAAARRDQGYPDHVS